MKQAENQTTVQ